MNCPSCNSPSPSDQVAGFCTRCGLSLTAGAIWLAEARRTLSWVLRRSLGGLITGLVGWWIVGATGRVAGTGVSNFGHLMMAGVLGGLFIGSVEGMLEESLRKTIRGALAGVIGGVIGASLGGWILHSAGEDWVMSAVVETWAAVGVCVGLVSAGLEGKRPRYAAGVVAGFAGGALGGWLGYKMYASVIEVAHVNGWMAQRLVEGIAGAILGAVFWFVLGLAEKLLIFKREAIRNISYKECEACGHDNILKAWYCAACGAVLQVSAPPEKLELPRRQNLARCIAGCHFLARLTGLASGVVAVLALYILGSVNAFVGLFGLLAVALAGFIAFTLFNSVADLLSPLL